MNIELFLAHFAASNALLQPKQSWGKPIKSENRINLLCNNHHEKGRASYATYTS